MYVVNWGPDVAGSGVARTTSQSSSIRSGCDCAWAAPPPAYATEIASTRVENKRGMTFSPWGLLREMQADHAASRPVVSRSSGIGDRGRVREVSRLDDHIRPGRVSLDIDGEDANGRKLDDSI